MKFSCRFSAALALCAATLLLCSGPTHAADDDQAARLTQADALLQTLHTEQMLTNATGRLYQMVDSYNHNASAQAGVTPEQKAAAQKAQEEAHAIIGKQLGWDAVKGDFVQAYAEAFTLDELKGLVAFYSSPIGQKLLEKQPAVTEKMTKLTQQKMMAVMPAVMQKIKGSTQKTPAVSPLPTAPAPAATVSPATPAP